MRFKIRVLFGSEVVGDVVIRGQSDHDFIRDKIGSPELVEQIFLIGSIAGDAEVRISSFVPCTSGALKIIVWSAPNPQTYESPKTRMRFFPGNLLSCMSSGPRNPY